MFLPFAHIVLGMDPRARSKPRVRPVRSDDEIRADLERRLEEIRREAARPENAMRCSDCVHHRKLHCTNPLVIGLGAPVWLTSAATDICGPERALWQPRASLWQRFLAWLMR